MPVRSATRLDRPCSGWPGSLITAVLSSRTAAWNGFAEAPFVPQSQVASGLLAYEAGKGRPTIREIHYCALRETAEPADLARAKSTSWLTQSASKGKTQTGCRSLSSEAVEMRRLRSEMVQKDACLIQLFLAATLHLWDLLPSKSPKSNPPHATTFLKRTLTCLKCCQLVATEPAELCQDCFDAGCCIAEVRGCVRHLVV